MTSSVQDHEASEFFDRCAREGLMYEFEAREKEILEEFLRLWAICHGMRILEPGCGSGRLTAVLANVVGANGAVVACDLSQEMLRLAQGRQLPERVQLLHGSAIAVECKSSWFDRVICLNVFPHFMDKAAALREFARLLKPTGELWINHFEGREALNRFHREAAPEVAEHLLPCPYTMRKLMEETGFAVIDLVNRPNAYWLKARKRSASPD